MIVAANVAGSMRICNVARLDSVSDEFREADTEEVTMMVILAAVYGIAICVATATLTLLSLMARPARSPDQAIVA
jgi:hypothetical protein